MSKKRFCVRLRRTGVRWCRGPRGGRRGDQPGSGPAHQLFALVLRQAAPHPVGLPHGQGVRRALGTYRAAHADLLGGGLAGTPGRAALALGMEEQGAVHASAGGEQLPVPQVCVGSGKAGEICHCLSPRSCAASEAASRPSVIDGLCDRTVCDRCDRGLDRTSTVLVDVNMTDWESSHRHPLKGRNSAKKGMPTSEDSVDG